MKTLDEQIDCARRELAMRRACYPKWVAAGRLKQEKAEHELATMADIVETLEQIKEAVEQF
jgi:hypothetical protein